MKNQKTRGIKLGQAGSLFNYLMSHNESVPKIGEGATILLYSDRHAYEVIDVNEKKKMVVLQRYAPKRVDNYGMGDNQHYEYEELTGEKLTLYFKWGSWKSKSKSIIFTDEFKNKYGEFGLELHDAYRNLGGKYNDRESICTLIPGVTKEKTDWHEYHIIFGVKEEYYDYSF